MKKITVFSSGFYTRITLICAVTVLFMFSNSAGAGQSRLYVGGNAGVYKDRGGDFDEDDNFTEIVLGVSFNPVLGVETSYLDFGKFNGAGGKADIDGYSLALRGSLPLSNSFSLFAKGGQLFWDADTRLGPISNESDGEDPFVGIGATFNVSQHFAVNLEYDRYRIDIEDASLPNPGDRWEGDLDTFKIGANLLF